jgi:hypothetical protein
MEGQFVPKRAHHGGTEIRRKTAGRWSISDFRIVAVYDFWDGHD